MFQRENLLSDCCAETRMKRKALSRKIWLERVVEWREMLLQGRKKDVLSDFNELIKMAKPE